MPDFASSNLSDASDNAAALRAEPADIADGATSDGPKEASSQRVRELPLPPMATQQRPHIDLALPEPTAWRRWWAFGGRRLSSGWAISGLFHFCLILALGLLIALDGPKSSFHHLTAHMATPGPALDLGDGVLDATAHLAPGIVAAADLVDLTPTPSVPLVTTPPGSTQDHVAVASQSDTPNAMATHLSNPLRQVDADVSGALDGRSSGDRQQHVGAGGGTPDSENAVERGLRWIKAHQRNNGSWNFDHCHETNCQGRCGNPGTETSTTAATAMALLPFLGAGHTHTKGEYRDVVRRGLYYLTQRALVTPNGVDLQDGTMYGQGLATIVFCEAYAMTGDENLKDYAQGAIDFICYAQNRKGGGWRYTPGEPGDTTVTGWQLMALKSGQMARLNVPRQNVYLVHRFLDRVQSDYGAQYGYIDPSPRQTTTAIGLLCRMYTGWQHDHPALGRGVAMLSTWAPSDDNIYYNYYATQVMHHWGGPTWERWNVAMRDYLIATQAAEGHEAGSWFFSGGHGDVGGRLYNTAVAVMTLEVYYRYMPLYSHKSVDGQF